MTTVNNTPPKEVCLLYALVGGTHVFTAEGIRGFHIGSADLKTAFDRSIVALGMHISRLTGVQAQYVLEYDYDEFLEHIQSGNMSELLVTAIIADQVKAGELRH
jgi:hypothetical protein